jgi:catechol 2,3-dioxygenase-like lactoylglutathione lyase family enzyme
LIDDGTPKNERNHMLAPSSSTNGPDGDDMPAILPVALGMAFTVDRMDHVVLNCRDADVTVAWYVRVLGMARTEFGDGRIALAFGNQKLNVRPTGARNWATAAVDAPGTLDLCFIADAEPDDIGAHLRACGVEITEGPVPKTGAMGPMTSQYCRDPDGNLVEVASYRRPD